MPTFCRHNRFADKCPICSRTPRVRPGAVSSGGGGRRASAAGSATKPPGKRRAPRAGDLVVRRVARAADDGYEHDLVPGLRATGDAARLADELAFADARLRELSTAPPGLYAAAAAAAPDDREEGLWLAFQIAYLSPLEGVQDPFAAIAAARTSWVSGALPAVDPAAVGPRTGFDPARGDSALSAYRQRAERAGSQAALLGGEPSLTAQRRFDRAFERLGLPGFRRAARYEFVLLCGRLGLLDAEPWSPALGETADPATLAAKRVFGIGDTLTLHRRAGLLAGGVDVPVAALDLALQNWARPEGERITAGATGAADPAVRDHIAAVLGAGG